jgi:hypothetical protein
MTNKYLKDSFILTSNLFTYDPTITIKNKKKCDVDGCFVIQANLLEIKGKKIKELTTNINLCLEISERIEKNWSIWQYNKIGFRLSYGLVPFHKIYNLAKTLKGDLICKKIDEQVSNPFLEELEDYYTYKKEQFLFISSSTPAVKIKNDTYLAVGHMKYKYEEINNVFPGTTLALFNLEIQNLKKHPAYVYLLFFYTFNPDNGDIISLGPALLPTPTEWGLAFPSGLELYKDKIIVAYGDHDSECKLLIMNKDIIPDTIPMSAKYYKFLLLKQPTTMEID